MTKKQKFSLRKYKVGVASVLVGLGVSGVVTFGSTEAHAAEESSEKLEATQEQSEVTEKQVVDADKEVRDTKDALKNQENAVANKESEKTAKDAEVAKLEKDIKEAGSVTQEEVDKAKKAADDAKNDADAKEASVKKAQDDVKVKEAEINKVNQDLAAVNKNLADVDSQLKKAEEVTELPKNNTNYRKDVKNPSPLSRVVEVNGEVLAPDKEAILNRLNEIRREAVNLGYASTYVPLKWSEELEKAAQVRAAEATFSLSHNRPNGSYYYTANQGSVEINAENLAWNVSFSEAIESLYREKEYYDRGDRNNANAGHYRNIINPEYTHVGMAGLDSDFKAFRGSNTYAQEFTRDNLGTSENTLKNYGVRVTNLVEVDEPSIKFTNIRAEEAIKTLKVGEGANLKVKVITENGANSWTPAGGKFESTFSVGLPWQSSDAEVASVDSNGYVVAKKAGTANITTILYGQKVNFTVTVTASENNNTQVVALRTQKQSLETQKQKLETSLKEKQNELSNLQSATKGAKEVREKANDLAKEYARLSKLFADLPTVQKELDDAKVDLAKLIKDLDDEKAKLANLNKKLSDAEAKFAALLAKYNEQLNKNQKEQEIPYTTKTVEDSTLDKGVREVRTKGVAGKKVQKLTATEVKDGKVVVVASEKVLVAPIDEVVAVGTKDKNPQTPGQGQLPGTNNQTPGQGQNPGTNNQTPGQGKLPGTNNPTPGQGKLPGTNNQTPGQGQTPRTNNSTLGQGTNSEDENKGQKFETSNKVQQSVKVEKSGRTLPNTSTQTNSTMAVAALAAIAIATRLKRKEK